MKALAFSEQERSDISVVPAQIAIRVDDLKVSFRKREQAQGLFKRKYATVEALKGISFEVRKGEIFGLLGRNGSGKSTLIRAISTLLIPGEGEVRIFGLDPFKESSKVRRLLNRVSVDAAFYKKLSARENLLYSARLYGVCPAEAEKKCIAILERLGMKRKHYYEPLEDMSRGMQQKIAIARAFLATPIVVLLDEPTTGLDPKSRRDVQEFVEELRSDHDATIILTTHDMPEAERLCDNIAFIHEGDFVAQGSAEELKAQAGATSLEDAFIELTGETIEG